MRYSIVIETERDQITLEWLARHGYDAGFLDRADLEIVRADGQYVYSMSEPDAWLFAEEIRDDPSAFLACNGSATLSASLLEFEESIV